MLTIKCGPEDEQEEWQPEDYDGENDPVDDDDDDDDWEDPGDEDIEWDGKYTSGPVLGTEEDEPYVDDTEDLDDAIDNPVVDDSDDGKPLSEDEFWPEL